MTLCDVSAGDIARQASIIGGTALATLRDVSQGVRLSVDETRGADTGPCLSRT